MYLESSNTGPVRYMGSIRRNSHSWGCHPCQLSFTPGICPINPFDTANSARTKSFRYGKCTCRAYHHLVRKPHEDAQADSAQIWTYLEWKTALQVTICFFEAFFRECKHTSCLIALLSTVFLTIPTWNTPRFWALPCPHGRVQRYATTILTH